MRVCLYAYVSGEFTFPKDVDILISIIAMHRDEKFWPNALTFDPDRFLSENKRDFHKYCYMPFSNGPRNCLGMYKEIEICAVARYAING